MGDRHWRKALALAALCALLGTLGACAAKSTAHYLDELAQVIKAHGYACTWEPLADTGREDAVPIFEQSSWYLFHVGQEEVLVYFDSSNRAKQLAQQFISKDEYPHVATYGLRYILVYNGQEEGVLNLLAELDSAPLK